MNRVLPSFWPSVREEVKGPDFCPKSAEILENNRVEFKATARKCKRACKSMKIKEIAEYTRTRFQYLKG
jgi:hypothetical protein